jgi:HK97 family phage major capsid protein
MEVSLNDAMKAAQKAGYEQAKKEIMDSLPSLVEQQVKNYAEPRESITRRYAPDILGSMDEAHNRRNSLDLGNTDKGIKLARFSKIAALSRIQNMSAESIAKEMYPEDTAMHRAFSAQVQRALGVATPSAGGFLVPTEFVAEIIPLLRTTAVVRKTGARTIPMETGTMEIPKQSGGASASYSAEAVEINSSQETLANLVFTAKKLVAQVPISNDLLKSAAISADQFVRDDMLVVMALREDLAFLRGNGVASTPIGVLFTNQVQSNVLGNGNGATPDMNTLPKIRRLAREAFCRFTKPAWVMTARTEEVFYNMKTANNVPVYREEMDAKQTLHGYPYFTTEQIPNTLTVGTSTNCSEIYFGDWNEAIIAEQTTMETQASYEASYRDSGGNLVSAWSLDQLVIKSTARHDFGLRQPAVFIVTTGVLGE